MVGALACVRVYCVIHRCFFVCLSTSIRNTRRQDYQLFLCCFFAPTSFSLYSLLSTLTHTHTLSLYRRIPHLPLRAMIGNMSKRSAVIAVMLAVALSLVFLFSVSSLHLSPSSYTGIDRASSPLSTKTTTKDFEPKYGCLANTASNITLSKQQWEQCIEPGQEASLYLSIVIVTRIDDYAG